MKRIEQVDREYEARKLAKQLEGNINDELCRQEILKFAHRTEKVTNCNSDNEDDPDEVMGSEANSPSKQIKSVFGQGTPKYKY